VTKSLVIRDLTVAYAGRDRLLNVVVSGVDLTLAPGQILGLAGESGCGKSTTALAAIGFPIPSSRVLAGSSRLDSDELLSLGNRELRRLWGRDISYVAQGAGRSLSPLRTVEQLVGEPLELHLKLRGAKRRGQIVELLSSVGISDPEGALGRYPHQFSGGQQQRIALAVALACSPSILILDEPTTGLDVTTQAQISKLIRKLVADTSSAALYVSHDLSLLGSICDDVAIMYGGEVVERSAATEVYAAPLHPYSGALLDSAPRIDRRELAAGIEGRPPTGVITSHCSFADRCSFVKAECREQHPALREQISGHFVRCLRSDVLGVIPSSRRVLPTVGTGLSGGVRQLVVKDLRCSYRGYEQIPAVKVSLDVADGEVLGIVGESGSGKSTLLRAIAGLHAPDAGEIIFAGEQLAGRARDRPREVRRAIQIVFQDPEASLNPRHTIHTELDRPLKLFQSQLSRAERRARALELLADVRLDPGVLDRRPHELSGGQKQRVALARAFAADPRLILCDEVVSALDVSVQASVLALLAGLVVKRDVALLFVTHDLAVVRSIADRVAVMRGGEICETAATEAVFERPEHPYTRELLAAAARPDASRAIGTVPSPSDVVENE
jgi:peptide/nickel transport system ATP-binding protein